MAIIKFIPPIHMSSGRGKYAHLKNALAYAVHPKKTAGGIYTGSQNCMINAALGEMIKTKEHYGKVPVKTSDRVGYHLIISWSPEEIVSPATALEIAEEFCREYLADYEAVYGVHLDTEHRHAHIVFNSVNFKTGKMYRYEKGEWADTLQPLVDKLCRNRNLHTLEEDTGISIADYPKYKYQKRRKSYGRNSNASYENPTVQEYSHSEYLRQMIDSLVQESSSYEIFETKLESSGYRLRYGKSEKYGEYLAVKNNEMRRYRRTHTLGKDYTLSMIKARIAAYHEKLPEYYGEETCFIIPAPVFHTRRFARITNDYIRKQYAHLYQIGVLQKGAGRLSYREVKQRVKELRRLEKALELISSKNYQNVSDIQADLEGQENEVKKVQCELKQLRAERRPYQQMLDIYREVEKLEGAYLLFKEGEQAFAKEAEAYEKKQQQAVGIPHKKEELEKYMEQQKEREKNLKKTLREEKQKLEIYKELQEDFSRVMAEYEPADEKMIQQMETAAGYRERKYER